MACSENNVGVSRSVSRFVLPICTTINMNGCAAFILVTVVYLMQNAGAEITPLMLAAWVLISTLAAVGNAGVPMGCKFARKHECAHHAYGCHSSLLCRD